MRPLIKKVLREYWEQEPDKWDLLADDLKDCLEGWGVARLEDPIQSPSWLQ